MATKKVMRRFFAEQGTFSDEIENMKKVDMENYIEANGLSEKLKKFALKSNSSELADFRVGSLLCAVKDTLRSKDIQEAFYINIETLNIEVFPAVKAKEQDYLKTYCGLFLYHNYKTSPKDITEGKLSILENEMSKVYDINRFKSELSETIRNTIGDKEYIENLALSIEDAITDYIKVAASGKQNLVWIVDFCKEIAEVGKNKYLESKQIFSDFEIKYASSESRLFLDHKSKDIIHDISNVLSACMRISFGLSNKNNGKKLIKTVEYLEHKPKDKYDPHNVSALACSTALKIRLESINEFKSIESYSMSYILDYIRRNGCIIKYCEPINEGSSKILKIIVSSLKGALSLRFCDRTQDIDSCIELVKKHEREFHPKVTWKNNDYSIVKMCEKGLKGIRNQDGELEGKQWRALGYFDDQGVLAFVDCKHRVDSNLELGIALTHPDLRGKYLVSSLIWYHILDNYASPVFTGTYETNEPMKHILEKCGFHDHYLVDGNKQSPRVKERFSVDDIPSSGGYPKNVNELSHYYMRVSEQSIVFDKLVKECSGIS